MGSRFAHLIVTINGRIAKKKQTTKVCDLFHGGDDRDRTDYLLNAIQALSQVSYAPIGTYHALYKKSTPKSPI